MFNLLIAAYIAVTAATEYWFGFTYDHKVYVVTGLTFADLLPLLRIEKAAASKGGHSKIRIKARVGELAALLPRARLLGPETILNDPKWNSGIKFEQIVTERVAGQKWSRDSVPFWIAGDLELNGTQIQVKFNGAELTNEKTIRNHFPALLS